MYYQLISFFIISCLSLGCQSTNDAPPAKLPLVADASVQKALATKTSVQKAPVIKPLNDRMIKANFSQKLGKLQKSSKTTSVKTLLNQLKKERKCTIEIPTAKSSELSTADLFKQCAPSTLIVGNIYNCGKCSKWHNGMASGYAIAPDVIATNYHVLDNSRASAMGIMNLQGEVYPIIEVLASNKADDVALARVKIPDGMKPLTPASISPYTPIGSQIGVISHPSGRFFTFTEGMISRYFTAQLSRDSKAIRMAITADYAKGSSGGPVFDQAGNICGMVSSTNSVYYSKDKNGIDKNLQMVFKNCVPSASVLKLIQKSATSKSN